MILKLLLTGLVAAMGLAACQSFTPYDYDDPDNRRQEQRDSCRVDPYQDACQPGGL